MAAWLAGAEVRISHEYECFTWLDRLLVTGTLPQDYSRHSIENNFDVLPLIGAKKKLASHEMEFFLERRTMNSWRTIFWRNTNCPAKKFLASTSAPAAPRICRSNAGR